MSNERERLAREWAESTLSIPTASAHAHAAAEHIMATTKEPTMADVKWDDEKHFLAGAECDVEGTVISVVMVGGTRDGEIYSVDLDENTGFWPMPCDLTPNGKRYKLVEVTGDEHPETLTTVEDYRRAHLGTIIAGEVSSAWQKTVDGWVLVGDAEPETDLFMAKTERTVLRWGWGE